MSFILRRRDGGKAIIAKGSSVTAPRWTWHPEYALQFVSEESAREFADNSYMRPFALAIEAAAPARRGRKAKVQG